MRIIMLVLLSTLLLGTPQANAHASLVRARPAANSAAHASPAQVTLWFTERLESAYSTIEVRDQAGNRVDQGDGQVDKRDPTVLRVSLKPLLPGTYAVRWRVISVDGHPEKGDFAFRVGP